MKTNPTKLRILFMKMAVFFERLRLDTKLILIYIVILAIPVMVFGIYSFRTVKNGIELDALHTSQQTVQKAKADINRNISLYDSIIRYVMQHRKFIDFIGAQKDYTVEELLEFKHDQFYSVENLEIINTDIYQLRFFIANPHFPEMWPVIYSEKRIYSCDWRGQVLNLKRGQGLWRLNHQDDVYFVNKTDVSELVSFYREVRNSDNEYVGILEVNMLAEVFFGDLYKQPPNDSVITYLLDSQGRLRSFTNGRLLPVNSGGSLLKNLKLRTHSGSGSFRVNMEKQSLLVEYTYIDAIDSYIYQITFPKALTKKIVQTRNLIFLGSFSALLLLSLITYLITSVILKKMRIIIASMRKVQEGDFKVEIPIRGVDEIGELAHHFRKMLSKINELIDIVVKKQVAAKDAEIRALQSQINAHFIYNVLEGIKMMAEIEEKYNISDAVTALGGMMRYSMNWTRHYVLLQEEINYIKDYIAIANIRYEDKLELFIDIDEEVSKQEVMKMLLQPLIENSINHGLRSKKKDGVIRVTAYHHGAILYIEIWDNGVGMEEARLETVRRSIRNVTESGPPSHDETLGLQGIALKNVHERIRLFYGNEFGIEIFSEFGEYTKVLVRLPLIKF
ncbi:MAG TPA: sensor histidine kinase [Bacillota bacterium]|nr:sensor histidine kinase [Bacillota bacterium]